MNLETASSALLGFMLIAVIILIGFGGKSLKLVDDNSEKILNKLAFQLATPALLFTIISESELTIFSSKIFIVSILAIASTLLISILLLSKIKKLQLAELAIFSGASVWVNANNIGLPVSIYVLGSGSYVAPIILLQLLVFIPTMLLVLDLSQSKSRSVFSRLFQAFKNPVTLASLSGLLVLILGIKLPEFIVAPLEILGSAAIPMMLLAFGMSLAGTKGIFGTKDYRAVLFSTAVLKLLVLPGCAFIIGKFGFGLYGTELLAAVLIAALPVAQNIYNFSTQYEIETRNVRDLVVISTVLSIPVIILAAAII